MQDPHSTLETLNRNRSSKAHSTINEMLQDPSTGQTTYIPDKTPSEAVPALMCVGGFFVAVFGLATLSQSILLGVILAAVGGWMTISGFDKWGKTDVEIKRMNRHEENEQRQRHTLETIRANQRVDALNALKELEVVKMQTDTQRHDSDNSVLIAKLQATAQVESSKYQAMGAAGDKEFIREYAKLQAELENERLELQQGHQSIEAQHNRKHEMDKLLKRFDHELKMWKERIEVDYRAEPARMQEELDAWDLEMAARESIEQETDEDAKIRKIKAFERRLSRRSA